MSALASMSTKSGFHSATRINRSLTAPIEKRALEWMAVRAPRWVTSDRLTLLGFSAQIACGVSFALARYHRMMLLGVIVCLALNWLGDSLDGTLARVRRIERPRYGFYVDHMADVFGSVALMLGLGCSGMLRPAVAVAMLLAFLVLAAESFLATYTLARFQLSQGLFGPTEIRIVLAIGTLKLLRNPWATIFGHRILLFDIGGSIAASMMFAMAVTVTLRHILQLYREEPVK
ncbi:MAG TPA: CDP-alcohol phosphatidyltransferase family protein [Terracidiphilus sp.]|nr:CDP-alcohol phosphatidyltransferase family protein [Terracidiphilus sp.]